MGLTADQRIIVAIVISFTAYGLGRNLLIYFVLSWLNPFLGAIVLAIRHMAKPAMDPSGFIKSSREQSCVSGRAK